MTAALNIGIVFGAASVCVITAVINHKAEITAAIGQGMVRDARRSITLAVSLIQVVAVIFE